MKLIKNIVIVGGGSSGWMTAATLVKVFPEKNITIVDSSSIPTIGVGESTLGSMNDWLSIIGIKKEDFMRDCDASYKLSIKFKNFYDGRDEGFHYPFGQPIFETEKNIGSPEEWQVAKSLDPSISVQDYVNTFYPASALINGNKYSDNLFKKFENFNPERDSTIHFDAAKFAHWLKKEVCIPNGVTVMDNIVNDIQTDDDGISFLILDNGEKVHADLFIDCTGFKNILSKSIGNTEFIDYSDIIPNNSAWATRVPYENKEIDLEPYTTCTAIDNGWCWNIPLWSRIGAGYVYSDKFVSKENALLEFKKYLSDKFSYVNVEDLDFKDISFRVGIHKKTWEKNVLMIGLSAGFIEPLESNGLFTVHEFLVKLCSTLEREKISQWDIDAYNTSTFMQFNDFATFVSMHYALSVRDDTPYWKNITGKTFFPKIINHDFTNQIAPVDLIMRKFNINNWGPIGYAGGGSKGLHCVATGMNYSIFPSSYLYLKYKNFDMINGISELKEKWNANKKRWQSFADAEPSLFQYLSVRIYNV